MSFPLQRSYDIPIEVELVPRPDHTLCLNDSVNRADLRHAGIDMAGGIAVMDPANQAAIPSWLPVEWDEPFAYCVSGPTILKRVEVDTFYDFRKN